MIDEKWTLIGDKEYDATVAVLRKFPGVVVNSELVTLPAGRASLTVWRWYGFNYPVLREYVVFATGQRTHEVRKRIYRKMEHILRSFGILCP